MIGFDDNLGAQRFIFADALAGGIHIIPALIGLFAIPQVMEMFAKGRDNAAIETLDVPKQSLMDSMRELTKISARFPSARFLAVLSASSPGWRADCRLVAYDQAQKFSRTKPNSAADTPKASSPPNQQIMPWSARPSCRF